MYCGLYLCISGKLGDRSLTMAFFSDNGKDEVAAVAPVYRASSDEVLGYEPSFVESDPVKLAKKRKVIISVAITFCFPIELF